MYLCSNHLLSQPERIEFYSHISNKADRPVGFAVKGVLVFFIIKETTASDKEGGSYPCLPGCERTLAWVSLLLDPSLDQCFFFFSVERRIPSCLYKLGLSCHFTPGSITGIGSLGLLHHPHCLHGAYRCKFALTEGAIPCDTVRLFLPCWLTDALVCSTLSSVPG